MSVPKNQVAPSGEVIRNSALSFVACAHPPAPDGAGASGGGASAGASSQASKEITQAPECHVPAGLKALCDAYSRLYPDQTNPLQVTTRLKYWLGGQDPLDYISMYWNAGKPEENIPPHWHYVSFGLSDLHGDGRVHVPADRVLLAAGERLPSGLGAELTFRLEAALPSPAHPAPPPLWPAALLQALARYLFTTGNKLVAGDHISWHGALDGGSSRVRHLLVAADPRLPDIRTPHGDVSFIQLVGCTGRELRAAQRGSGIQVLNLMAEDPHCGGSWLVTRMRRRGSARRVRVPGPHEPALLAGVSARMRFEPWAPAPAQPPASPQNSEQHSSPQLSLSVERQIKETLQRGLSTMSISTDRSGPEGHSGMSTDSFGMSSMERALPQIPELMQSCGSVGGGAGPVVLRGVHLALDAGGASVLPLALAGRVLCDRHFTWRCGPAAATVLACTVTGAAASRTHPYVLDGCWLQMLIPEELARDMVEKVSHLSALAETDSESDSEAEDERKPPTLPLSFTWPEYNLKISVLPDHELL